MAITAKAYFDDAPKNAMLNALVTTGYSNFNALSRIAAKTSSGIGSGSYYAAITWGSISSGSVAKSNTPVINVAAGVTINFIETQWYDTNLTDYVPAIVATIDAESFPYAGSITITSATLSISSTIV